VYARALVPANIAFQLSDQLNVSHETNYELYVIEGHTNAYLQFYKTTDNMVGTIPAFLTFILKLCMMINFGVHAMALLVEALRYKPEGRGFDSRWCHWNFSLT
jgi:hypothetical protein